MIKQTVMETDGGQPDGYIHGQRDRCGPIDRNTDKQIKRQTYRHGQMNRQTVTWMDRQENRQKLCDFV